MSLKHDSLASLFTDIADNVRLLKGSSDPIVADDLPDAMLGLPLPAVEEEFVEKTCPHNGPARLLKVFGKSVVWNQLFNEANFHSLAVNTAINNSSNIPSFAVSNGTCYITKNEDGYVQVKHIYYGLGSPSSPSGKINGHKYLIKGKFRFDTSTDATQLAPLSQAFYGDAFQHKGEWAENSVIITADNTTRMYVPLYHTQSDKNIYIDWQYCHIVDLTLLYGAGNEPTTVAQFLADYPTYDPTYDPGSLQSNKTSELRAYDGGTLRGSLQLNLSTLTSGGVAVFPDGMCRVGDIRDEAEGSTGIVRIGRVDLGDLTYGMTSGAFYATVSGRALGKLNLKCPLFTAVNSTVSNLTDGQMMGATDSARVYFKNSAYADATAFKTAMNGVYLEFELATPTTYLLDTPLPTSLQCQQNDILKRVSGNNCPFVGEIEYKL